MNPVFTRCLLIVSLAAVAPIAMAQQTARPPAKPPTTSASRLSMQGCINGGREAFTFTQMATGATFRLQGDPNRFMPFRGKLVEITGHESPPVSTNGLKDLPGFAISEMRLISAQCPTAVQGKIGSPAGAPATIPPAQNTPSQSSAPTAGTPRYAPPGAPNQKPPEAPNNPNIGGDTGAPSPGSGNPPPAGPPPAAPPKP